MKKVLIAFVALLSAKVCFSQPPQGPPKPPPAEERWQRDSKKINESLGLSTEQLSKLKIVFMDFYKDMDALREKMEPPKPPKEEMDKILDKRNSQLKKLLTTTQLEKFNEVEKTLGPPKRHGKHPHPPVKAPPIK